MDSKIYVNEVWNELIFELFYISVSKDSGDGAACICCDNIEETSEAFIKWWLGSKYHFGGKTEFYHSREEYSIIDRKYINFHDSNENFMFCDKEIGCLGHGDLVIVIQSDCKNYKGDITIKAVKND